MNYPKILFINVKFKNDSSDGITISKVFEKYPQENLSSITFSDKKDDMILIGNYFFLDKNTPSNQSEFNEKEIKQAKGLKKFYIKIRRSYIGIRSSERYRISDILKKWMLIINPDFIFINTDNKYELIDFTIRLSDLSKKKIIVHVLDDKVNYRFPGIMGFYYNHKLTKCFNLLIKNSTIRFCISELMQKEYEERYKQKFFILHNSVDLNLFKYVKLSKKNNMIRICYRGVLDYNYKTLITLAQTIDELNKKGYEIILTIYTKLNHPQIEKKLADFKSVFLKEFISQKDLINDFDDFDYLFLPMPFEKSQKFIRLSLSCKLSEYLASGVPIIVLAPSNSAVVEYSIKNDFAYVLTSTNKKYLYNSLEEIFNKNDSDSKRRNGRNIAEKEHNKELYQKYVHDLLLENINNYSNE
ncbi:glycosyltransferase family 1 protein [Candidatus Parcubacteria bacterium]|nr:MAG: glycosyltransferase family 1 protein [Candidatus Parcubacteria bacterium]